MAYETLTGGLQLVIPTSGQTNWGTVIKTPTWEKINAHTHTGSGDGNQIPTGGIEDGAITKAKLANNIGLVQQATLTPAGTSQAIDFDQGAKVILDLSSATGDVTLTLSNPIEGADYRIKVIQGGTKRSLIWPANVKWPQGEEFSQFHEINTVNMVWLDYDGTDYLVKWELDYS